MKEERIDKLLRKHLMHTISDEEKIELQEWLDQQNSNPQLLHDLEKVWIEKSVEPEFINTDSMVDKIWQEGLNSKNADFKYFDWNYFLKIAATVVIFIGLPVLLALRLQEDQPVAEVKPEIITKVNPAGQKSKIYLPDGSIVWLNGASRIQYASFFDESYRNVVLEGEAFFEVAEDPDKPFSVTCGIIKTTALGTLFNVEAYSSQDLVKISLVTGKVKIEKSSSLDGKTVMLNPGYQVIYQKDNQEMIKKVFDEDEVIGWKDGKLIFRSASYPEVIEKLERWYGISILTEGSPPKGWRLSTEYKDETLLNILKNLRFGKEFNYELKKDLLKIKFD